ncbi:MAG: cation transporter [Bacteroidaceae bacterium]|nr:cation transporter [Bacteroidaceae bacterium]
MSNTSNREKEIFRVTWIGSIVNLLLVVLKFVAGIAGHSAAMVADAVHSISDFVTDIIVIVFVRISGKPEDEGHDYGHGKYETLATAIIGLILFFVGIGILFNATKSVIDTVGGKPLAAPSMLALAAAALSIVLKEILFRYTIHKSKKLNSQAMVANAWHHRSDAFSSIGTFVGIGGAICLGEQWRILDPLAAIVVSVFIIKVALQLLNNCVGELLERSLPAETEERIQAIIMSFPGISSPHHLRTRRIGNHVAIEVHIRMDGSTLLVEAHALASKIEGKLKEEFGEDTHIGIHMEPLK